MKIVILAFLSLIGSLNLCAQHSIQASLRKSVTPCSADVLFRPNYDSDSGEYVNNLVISVAVDDTVSSMVVPYVFGAGNFYSLSFTPSTPFTDTIAGKRVYTWTCTNDSVTTMSWKNDAAFIGLTIVFTGDSSKTLQASLVDFSHSGSSSSPYFNIGVNKSPYNVINSSDLFFPLFSVDNNGSSIEKFSNNDQMITTNLEIDVDGPIQ